MYKDFKPIGLMALPFGLWASEHSIRQTARYYGDRLQQHQKAQAASPTLWDSGGYGWWHLVSTGKGTACGIACPGWKENPTGVYPTKRGKLSDVVCEDCKKTKYYKHLVSLNAAQKHLQFVNELYKAKEKELEVVTDFMLMFDANKKGKL